MHAQVEDAGTLLSANYIYGNNPPRKGHVSLPNTTSCQLYIYSPVPLQHASKFNTSLAIRYIYRERERASHLPYSVLFIDEPPFHQGIKLYMFKGPALQQKICTQDST